MEKQKKQKSINKLLTLMLAFVMVFTGMGVGSWGVSEAWADVEEETDVPTSTAWDGTTKTAPKTDDNGVYQIGTGEELAWFAGLVNGILTDGTAQNKAADAVLTEDIDLGGKEWTPIAQKANGSYTGSFNGQGYKVLNLTITKAGAGKGLFGYNEGKIINIQIESANVKSTNPGGILLGQNRSGEVKNCAVVNSVWKNFFRSNLWLIWSRKYH